MHLPQLHAQSNRSVPAARDSRALGIPRRKLEIVHSGRTSAPLASHTAPLPGQRHGQETNGALAAQHGLRQLRGKLRPVRVLEEAYWANSKAFALPRCGARVMRQETLETRYRVILARCGHALCGV